MDTKGHDAANGLLRWVIERTIDDPNSHKKKKTKSQKQAEFAKQFQIARNHVKESEMHFSCPAPVWVHKVKGKATAINLKSLGGGPIEPPVSRLEHLYRIKDLFTKLLDADWGSMEWVESKAFHVFLLSLHRQDRALRQWDEVHAGGRPINIGKAVRDRITGEGDFKESMKLIYAAIQANTLVRTVEFTDREKEVEKMMQNDGFVDGKGEKITKTKAAKILKTNRVQLDRDIKSIKEKMLMRRARKLTK